MRKVFIESRNYFSYPDCKYNYAPSTKYPEYQWDDIAPVENVIYDMVRSALKGYGLDEEHYGTKEWDPLGDIIRRGDTVLVKPNWVLHYNENHRGGTDCLFTNTSITRAIVDYVAIALSGSGRIIVADSPMPNCDFSKFRSVAHIDTLQDSCNARGVKIEIQDLRGSVVENFSKCKVEVATDGGLEIDLAKESYFYGMQAPANSLRYSFLDATEMNEYFHTKENHRYIISKTALSADVVINLPKIKTHRKAGYTAALKNYIGICFRKDSIPHFVKGEAKVGGDEFNGPKIVFQTESNIRDRENRYENQKKTVAGLLMKGLRLPFWAFRHALGRKYQGVGNWHGNDTIWRAVLDINEIMYHCDRNGVMHNSEQRKFLSIGDMVVAGQRNGPLSPTPCPRGYIVCSEDPVAFDKTILQLMGFKANSVPLIRGLNERKKWSFQVFNDDEVTIKSSTPEINNISLLALKDVQFKSFLPADGWDCLKI